MFALMYIRNGKEILFPVRDIKHAIILADNIADSDLLNDDIDFNMFDVFQYHNGAVGEAWESEDGRTFEEIWQESRS